MDSKDKVLPDRDDAKSQIDEWRRGGDLIVFTNGCFDVLHVGHLQYLEESRKLGDRLVIGLNSDRSVTELKGSERPFNTESDRTRLLAGMTCVSLVTVFDQSTPLELIKHLRPDILVKGADWEDKEIVGGKEVQGWGGRVITVKYVEGKSTTSLVDKIRNS